MSSTKISLGKDATVNRNTGTHGTPVWVTVGNVNDVDLGLDKDTDDVTIRGGGGWEMTVATIKKAQITFGMNHDTTDADWTVLHGMFLNDTAVEFLIADGPAVTGAQGLRATMICDKFGAKQTLKGAQKDEVQLKPTVGTTPDWFTYP